MLIILSPAKTLDFKSSIPELSPTQPRLHEESVRIMKKLKTFSRKSLAKLMDISTALSEENHQRIATWTWPFPVNTARPAIFAFKGDAYQGFDPLSMSIAELERANARLRILSGLHGLLRPFDQILPYRLEMGTKLQLGRNKDLYSFWGGKISELLLEDMGSARVGILVNLASAEYYKALVNIPGSTRIITPVFREFTKGQYRFVSFNAKRARGAMASWIIRNDITDPQELKGFDGYGYSYNDRMSSGDDWYFTRD